MAQDNVVHLVLGKSPEAETALRITDSEVLA